MMPKDIKRNGKGSADNHRHAAGKEKQSPKDALPTAGDIVGHDKISAGDIKDSAVAMGEGALAVQGDAHFHFGPEAKKAKPRLDYEPQMVLVPSGTFLMGSDGERPEEAPLHEVALDAYAIGRYPITNEQFARFVWDTNLGVKSNVLQWYGNEPPESKMNHPVAGVTWYEARAYCRWLEEKSGRPYRLPNEAQWEKAARGEDGRRYPWGNEWKDGHCNSGSEITAVDEFREQSIYGCHDMVGNAREWTVSVWGQSLQAPDPQFVYPWKADRRNNPSEPGTTWRVYRGGRFHKVSGYRCSTRGGYLPDKPGPASNRHGFRVVLSS